MNITAKYEDEHTWMFRHNVLRDYKAINGLVDVSEFPAEVTELVEEITTSDVGVLDEVENLIGAGNYDAAFSLNESVVPDGNYPAKLKEINSILIPQWQQIVNDYQYRLADEIIIQSTLEIANLCMIEYGDAVLKARVFAKNHIDPMLEFNDPCEIIYSMEERSLILDDGQENENLYMIYPNPAADKFFMSSANEEEINYNVTDLQGRVVLTGIFNSSTTIKVNV